MAPDDEGRLRAVALLVVERAGYDLEEFAVATVGRRRLVRVVIDADTGVSLDDAAQVSRDISARLDAENVDSGLGAYTLEVTSPGVGRPLTQERHFRRARGRLVKLILTDGSAMDGRVLAVSERTLHLLVGESGVQRESVPLDRVTRGRVEVEFAQLPAKVAELLALVDSEQTEPDGPTGPAKADPAKADQSEADPSSEEG